MQNTISFYFFSFYVKNNVFLLCLKVGFTVFLIKKYKKNFSQYFLNYRPQPLANTAKLLYNITRTKTEQPRTKSDHRTKTEHRPCRLGNLWKTPRKKVKKTIKNYCKKNRNVL